jgi:predicted dehydrogenase
MYKALLIGCGSIGALKPDKFDYTGSANILTHANAYTQHPRIELVGVVDTDKEKAYKAGVKWGCSYYESIYEAFKHNNSIDVVSVCTPTDTHYDVMLELLKYNFKLLIAEKPFCGDLHEAEVIASRYKEEGVPILIDYIRHFEPEYIKLKKQISDGLLKPVMTRAIYNRGFKRDGCHILALLKYLFGNNIILTKLLYGHIEEIGDDFSFSMQLKYKKCKNVILAPTDGRDYSIFDIDIFFKDRRINFTEHGLYMDTYMVGPEKTYGNYNALPNTYTRTKTQLKTCLLNMVDNAVRHLRIKEDLICTPQDAIEVHRILERLV